MISSVMLSGVMILATLGPDQPSSDTPAKAAYNSAAAAAGKNASAQVRLALWCEAHGLTAERLEHLSRAILDQPSNALARGLLGFVRYQGEWERPDTVAQKLQDDSQHQRVVREYLKRRAATPDTAKAQMDLAAWCAANHLKDEALAHYQTAARLDPSRDAAWRSLGYKKHGNRWVKPEQVAAEKQEAIRQKQADKHWRTKLAKLRDDLRSKDAAKRSRAERAIGEVTDSRAVPSIWAVFVTGGVRHQLAAIKLFGQIDGPSASNALAAMAILSPWAEVRTRATETLLRRDPRDVVGRLIGLIHNPYKYEVRRSGSLGSPGELFVEGERFNFQRFYENQTAEIALQTSASRIYSPDVPFDPFSIPNVIMATGAWAASLLSLTPNGLRPSSSAPIDPSAAAQAMKAIAANPKDAQAILKQLANDPNNRIIPPGYTFTPTDPAYSTPVGRQTPAGGGPPPSSLTTPTPAMIRGLEALAAQLRAQESNPLSPLGIAMELQKLENNPAHQQSGQILAWNMQIQQMAAQRDMQIGFEVARARQAKQDLQQQLAMDVQFIERTNDRINQTNSRVLPVLKAVTGLDLGIDREKWKTWWISQLIDSPGSGSAWSSPMDREAAPSTGRSGPSPNSAASERRPRGTDAPQGPDSAISVRASFAGGTPVQTMSGPRPVEALTLGDLVLCQNGTTGALEYQPVLAAHRSTPQSVLQISARGESIVATGLQRFWKSGHGWTMARDLKAGDRLRIGGGVMEVTSIASVAAQPVYNISVAGNADLFVGAKSILAHDFSVVPVVAEPFDRYSELTEPPPSDKADTARATNRAR